MLRNRQQKHTAKPLGLIIYKKTSHMKLIPFKEINEEDEFWGGARFVKLLTKLMIVDKDNDFFEYMLIDDKGMSDWMICAHIDQYEAGSVISHVKQTIDTNRHTVLAKEFKRSNILDKEIDLWFYHQVVNDRYWTKKITKPNK